MIKVFNGARLIELGDDAARMDDKNLMLVKKKVELYIFLNKYFKIKNQPDIVIYGYDNKKLFRDFKSYFNYLRAAGGIVKNEKNQALFIKRKGIWDLPKGKLEEGEKPKAGAQREVTEETGVGKLKVGEKLTPTFHIFKRRGKLFLKKTDWYLMEAKSTAKMVPQLEEKITKVAWLDKKKATVAIESSYRSLHDSFVSYIEN